MKTSLPAGAVIRFKSRGRMDYWQVTGDGYTGLRKRLRPGDTVNDVVWKGDVIEVRRVRTVATVTYKPMFTLPPDRGPVMNTVLAAAGLVCCDVVINGHTVMIMGDGGTSIHTGVASWTWISDKLNSQGFYDSIGPSAAILKGWSDQQVVDWAEKAVDKMHKQSAGIGCAICNVPSVIDEVTFKRGK